MSGELRDALGQIISLIILAMPLFLLPALLKLSGSILGRINDMTRRGVGKFGGDQAENYRKGRMKEAYGNSRLAGALGYRKAVREYKGVMRRANTPDFINKVMGGSRYADSTRRRAAAYEEKELREDVESAKAAQVNKTNAERVAIATDASQTQYARIAAVQEVLAKGNYRERKAIYDSIGNDDKTTPRHLRQAVAAGYHARGDSAVMFPGYGDMLLNGEGTDYTTITPANPDGTTISQAGSDLRNQQMAKAIRDGRITGNSIVYDAEALRDMRDLFIDTTTGTKDIAKMATYGLTQVHLDAVKAAIIQAQTNTNTRAAADSDQFKNTITEINAL